MDLPSSLYNREECGAIDPETGAVCFIKKWMGKSHGDVHVGWVVYPEHKVTWPVEEDE